MKIYCYRRCSTCKKALAWLEEKGISCEVHDIKEEHPDVDELRCWYKLSGLPLKKFFNTSGLVYREMGLKDKLPSMSEEEQLQILSSDGMLIKRPMVIGDDFVLLGFREAQWEERLLP